MADEFRRERKVGILVSSQAFQKVMLDGDLVELENHIWLRNRAGWNKDRRCQRR